MDTAKQFIFYVEEVFANNLNNTNALSMSAYMRNKFDYFGIKSPLRNELQTAILKTSKPQIADVEFIVKHMWNSPQRELQYFGMDIFNANLKHLSAKSIDFIEFLIVNKSWWDTVDFIAANIVGKFFKIHTNLLPIYTEKWINSDNIWLKRTAIIFQLKYKKETDFNLLKHFILKTSNIDEFFIKKAIGWALREYSKLYPNEVADFILNNKLKPLSVREGLKHIEKQNNKLAK
jgi:3-methyladenine DNA glycosylase AlkD